MRLPVRGNLSLCPSDLSFRHHFLCQGQQQKKILSSLVKGTTIFLTNAFVSCHCCEPPAQETTFTALRRHLHPAAHTAEITLLCPELESLSRLILQGGLPKSVTYIQFFNLPSLKRQGSKYGSSTMSAASASFKQRCQHIVPTQLTPLKTQPQT